jgi:predicted dehydrogenase
MLKVGIIGLGKMGLIREKEVNAYDGAEVSAIYEPGKEGGAFVESADKIIDDPEINCIFICTPNMLNKPLTIKSLRAGKHVFCEKPPAFTTEEMLEIRQAESESGKVLMYGFNHRHHGSIKRMKELLDNKEFGNILWMRGRYGKSVDESFYDTWRSKKETAGGGILMDQGIHMLDLFLHFAGSFNETHAFVSNSYCNLDVEDNVFAILKNSESGVVASLHSTMTQWRHLFSIEVFMEKGYMVLNGLKTSSNSYGEEVLTIAKNRSVAPAATWEDEERTAYHEDHSWESEINQFFDSVKNGTKVQLGSSEDALKLIGTIESIYNSDPSFGK